MISIRARISNSQGDHQVQVSTNGQERSIPIPAKTEGLGSSANGGELLFLALATCCCNDIYREAAKRQIPVYHVAVDVSGEFDAAPGSIAQNVVYHVRIQADANEDTIRELVEYTDSVEEIQNTLRRGIPVRLGDITVG